MRVQLHRASLLPRSFGTSPLRIACALACAALLASSPAAARTLHHRYTFDPSRIQVVPDGSASRIRTSGMQATWEEGEPELPYEVITFLVPRGSRITDVRVQRSGAPLVSQDLVLAPAAAIANDNGDVLQPKPPQLDAATLGVASNVSSAGKPGALLAARGAGARFYPAVLAEPAGGGALHGYQLASVRIFPVRYDTGDRLLVVERELDVEVDVESGGAVPLDRQRYSPEIEARAERTLRRLVVNPTDIDGYARRIGRRIETSGGGFRPTEAPSLEGSPVDEVIVTSSSLAPAWQALADWKTRRGVPTVVRTTEWIATHYRHGSDLQETIRNFVRDAYLQWGVQYVLLAGDTDVIPARYGYSVFGEASERSIPTDMYFACLDGNWNLDGDGLFGEAAVSVSNPGDSTDLYAEVFVGRAPSSTPAQASALVGKILAYENPSVTNYQNHFLFIGEVLFPIDWTPGNPITLDGGSFSEEMLALTGACLDTVRLYENDTAFPGALHLTKSRALLELDSGPGFVNHIGHGYRYNMSLGDASMTNADALALTNTQQRFVLYMLNCTATAFDFPCLAEAFLQSPGGAVAVLGSSRSAYALPSRNYNREFHRALHQDGYRHLGEIFVQSRLSYTPAAYFDTSDHYTHFLYNMLGDPEMVVHTCSLTTTVATRPDTVGLGAANILVHVTAGGAPQPGALVCLQKGPGGIEAYVTGTTDSNGDATLALQPESAGFVLLTISGQNMTTLLDSIEVVPQPAGYVHVSSLALDDDASGGSDGNGDGILDAGESFELDVNAINDGPAAATNVEGVLRIPSAYATVVDSAIGLGSLTASGGTALSFHEVVFTVDPAAPDGTVLPLVFELGDGVSSWSDRVNRVVHAPSMELTLLAVDDPAPGGNGDGQIQAGETFDLAVFFKNYGSGAAEGLLATIASADPDIAILVDSMPIGAGPPQVEVSGATRFRITENLIDENVLELTLADSRGRWEAWPITLRGPAAPAAPSLSTKSGGGMVTVTWTPSAAPDLSGYHVYRALASIGPWSRVTIDRTVRTAYFQDTGLAPSTKYFYAATAVDSSGNESPRSAVSNINTNPAQLAGWPIQLGAQSSCPAAIGDLTGNGSKEIVAGNDHLYAWNWNGYELRDDDANPLTWGVFSTEVKTVTGAVALAEMDGDPGLEVLVTSWADTNRVYAVRGDGSFLPGWPRNPDPGTASAYWGYWASAAAADVDGDGLAELFAPAKNGNLYAWHADGSPLGASAAFATGFGVNQRTSPSFADLDADPELEIIFGGQNGSLYIWNPDGSNFPHFPVSLGALCLSNTAVGDVNQDGVIDVVMLTEGGSVHVVDTSTGTELAGWPKGLLLKGNPISPSPALADFDADGYLEIVVANNGGSSPSSSRIQVYDYLGNVRTGWPRTVGGTNSESSPIIADLSGDGSPDVVFGNESGFLFGWDAAGNDLPGFPITIGDFIRSTPFADDVDGDGHVNLVLAGWDKNVYVWDFAAAWNPAAAQWPTLKHDLHRSGAFGFVYDIAPPSPPAMLASSSHTPGAWSGDPTVDVGWSGATDASGIGGYSFLWDTDSTTVPDDTLDTTFESTTSPALAEGQSHWFHLRTVDTLGHWTTGAQHLGPFWIDTTPPANSPAASADRPAAVWSTDNTIEVTWSQAVDPVPAPKTGAPQVPAGSGIGGYSVLWDTDSLGVPDASVDTESLGTASPPLADGRQHWFHLRAVDAAGNAADPASTLRLGPFWVDATPPAVAVLLPNGGESLELGSVAAIHWNATDATSGVQSLVIHYSDDGGATYPNLVASVAPGDSTFAWTVPAYTSSTVRVRVTSTDVAGNSAADASDADFAFVIPVDVAVAPPVTRTWIEPPAPNPFNPSTTLRYSLLESGRVRVVVYDVHGRVVRVLVDAWQVGPHWYEARWDGTTQHGARAPSGVYLAAFQGGGVELTRRLVLAK